SDKAYQPVSLYGNSKASAEGLFLHREHHRLPDDPHFYIVRYGNVWGSTGSVVPRWRAALASGDRPEVRDPEATRFFMTREDRANLVLQAADGHHAPGERIIPRWLPAFAVKDLVEAMEIKDFELTKLPWWEKQHESMEEGCCSLTARRMPVEELR